MAQDFCTVAVPLAEIVIALRFLKQRNESDEPIPSDSVSIFEVRNGSHTFMICFTAAETAEALRTALGRNRKKAHPGLEVPEPPAPRNLLSFDIRQIQLQELYKRFLSPSSFFSFSAYPPELGKSKLQ